MFCRNFISNFCAIKFPLARKIKGKEEFVFSPHFFMNSKYTQRNGSFAQQCRQKRK